MGSTHWSGPLLVNGGAFDEAPIEALGNRSNYKVWIENFDANVADITAIETLGWAETEVGTTTSRSNVVSKATGYLLLNPGTADDTGTNIQHNVVPTTSAIVAPHKTCGPLTSTTTLMDNRELLFETRIGVSGTTAAWSGKTVIGWVLSPDTALMTVTSGVPAIGTGGGIGFNIREDGVLRYFTQSTTVHNSVTTHLNIATLGAANVIQWYTLGFRARWLDASAATGVVDFYLDGGLLGSVSNDMPMTSTEVYAVSYEMLNGGGLVNDLYVDYIVTGLSRPGFTIP
jgi:hypothetical protein